MAYQLKTTGIAANCKMLIAVDPDTGTIKDFASSAVTSDMTVGANVTINEQAWDGITRKYWVLGSGTTSADFIAFGTNKPLWQLNSGGRTAASAVWIGELVTSSHGRMFGSSSSNYLGQIDTGAGGSTHPAAFIASNSYNGGQANAAPGKRIYGWSFTRSGSRNWYTAADTASSMTTGSGSVGAVEDSYSLSYIARRNDNTTHNQDKVHCIAIFDVHLTEAQWDSLRDDWFGTLLEAASGGAVEGDLAATEAADVSSITGDVIITGTLAATEAADVAAFSGGSTPVTGDLDATEASDTAAATGTVRNPRLVIGPLKNNTGTLLANETGATVYVYQTSGAHVVTKTSQTTDGSAIMTVSDAAMAAGTTYRYVIVLGSGAEGMDKSAAG